MSGGATQGPRGSIPNSQQHGVEDATHDRTGKPVVCRDTSHAQGASQTRFSHDSTNFNVEDETNHDRTGQPVVCRDASHEPGNEQSMLNEVNIDFRLPGLPHSVVKQAENSRVRELVKKIENHPHRHALQRDLQQNKAYNPFSTTTKKRRAKDKMLKSWFEQYCCEATRGAEKTTSFYTGVSDFRLRWIIGGTQTLQKNHRGNICPFATIYPTTNSSTGHPIETTMGACCSCCIGLLPAILCSCSRSLTLVHVL